MNKIEGIIFDWAGTTVDYGCFAPVKAFAEVFSAYGIEATIEETRKPMGMLKREHIKTMLKMPRINDLFQRKYNRYFTEEDVDAMNAQFENKLMSILQNYADPKPYTIDVIHKLREKNIKIGSTTGYTDKMMAIVAPASKEKGYAPDVWVSPTATNNIGRPYPYMIFENLKRLNILSVSNVLKVGDTVSDILEGKNAGVLTVGVIEGSSELGLTQDEFKSLTPSETINLVEKVKTTYHNAGASYIINDLRELLPLIDEINQKRQ